MVLNEIIKLVKPGELFRRNARDQFFTLSKTSDGTITDGIAPFVFNEDDLSASDWEIQYAPPSISEMIQESKELQKILCPPMPDPLHDINNRIVKYLRDTQRYLEDTLL